MNLLITKLFSASTRIKIFLLIFSASFTFLLSCNSNGKQGGGSDEQETTSPDPNRMMEGEDMMRDGMMSEEMREAMMSQDMGPEMMKDMRVIRTMLMNHEKIERRVENRENGVKTWTTSDDPDMATAIQTHVRQMKKRMEEKKPIRQMDPVFREIFDHADKIEIQIKDIKDGVVVVETSEDPQVVKLIQQHANRAVSEFVEEGMQRAMQPTPLPEGYEE